MKTIIICIVVLFSLSCFSQDPINQKHVEEDLHEILNNISQNYVYFKDKNVDLNCLREYYISEIKNLKKEEETVLFFEYLLDEFYDSHLILQTNRNSSYRLFSPIYAVFENGKPIISNVWQSQIEHLSYNVIGAEIEKINGTEFDQAIKDFPTHCNNKNTAEVKEWIANKLLSGRYNEPRLLKLKLSNGNRIELDLDSIKLKEDSDLLTVKLIDDIAVVKINNSLGNDNLVSKFDSILIKLMNKKGIVIDLRNTINGGDTYEARGIMSRFINEPKAYQKHEYIETSENNPDIVRSWVEYVIPRLEQYKNPVAILVGRWTGSMGEGLAIGFEGIGHAKVIGSEMRRLAGEVYDFSFKHQNYGYKIPTAKLYHINGTIREKYVPTNYVKQTTVAADETLDKGLLLIKKMHLQTDSILRKELELIGKEDQTLRLLLPNVIRKYGRDSYEYKYVWSLINRQDSICLNKVILILETHGWVAKSRIGAQANQAIWLVMQHTELELQEQYLPLFKKSVEKGESEGWHLAFFEDRILMRKKKEQIYGTQTFWDNDLKKNVIYPIADVENVNKRRKQLRLEPIEKYAESNGYIFDQ